MEKFSARGVEDEHFCQRGGTRRFLQEGWNVNFFYLGDGKLLPEGLVILSEVSAWGVEIYYQRA